MPLIKRLFVDIETSPNVGYFWRTGTKITLTHDNILQERAIITICYKWEGRKTVEHLTWDGKGSDKAMLKKFVPILMEADEVIAHNGDRFDLPWIKGRCVIHRIRIPAQLPSVDTLKQSKRFGFNCHKLDYLGQVLGLGRKTGTDYGLWKEAMKFRRKALAEMVNYCKQDVLLLEKVHQTLQPYVTPPQHVGVKAGGYKHHCPECGGDRVKRNKRLVTAAGTAKVEMKCNDCERYYTVAERTVDAEQRQIAKLKQLEELRLKKLKR